MTKAYATYTIACVAFEPRYEQPVLGQSFTLNNQGPDGTGTPPKTGTVKLRYFCVGYPDYALAHRAPLCYLYNIVLTDPHQIGQTQGMVAISRNNVDDVMKLGSGTYSRQYWFDPVDCEPLDVNATYYLYFPKVQYVRATTQSDYSGGNAYNYDCDSEPNINVQFQAEISYIP